MQPVRIHLARYPLMQVEDLYKLVHQSVFGNAHAAGDPEAARARLLGEIAGLETPPACLPAHVPAGPPVRAGIPRPAPEAAAEPDAGEPMIDPISGDGSLVRVHLRPYVGNGCAPDALLSAFLRTASLPRGSLEEFRRAWDEAVGFACAADRFRFTRKALGRFAEDAESAGLPPVSHSAPYRAAYRPAYRVVLACLLE